LNDNIKKRAENGEFEEFDPEANDGSFLMRYSDWRKVYNNLFCCVKFPKEWSGKRFYEEWTEETAFGCPNKSDPNSMENWAKNPQFIVKIDNKEFNPGKKTTKIFIGLGQPDGKIFPFVYC
jgi:calpain